MTKPAFAAWRAGRAVPACTRVGGHGLGALRLLVVLWLSLLMSGAGCSSKDKVAFDSGLPTIRSAMQVVEVQERGPYLEAHLTLDRWELEAYSLPSEVCRAVFVAGETVRYVDDGPLGTYTRGEDRCQALGVGNLELWRDRSRSTGRRADSVIPRSQATFRTMHSDSDFVMLRGFFPQAGRLRFASADDIVAVVPTNEVCSGPIESGVASIEYRPTGRQTLTLVGRNGLCVIRALVMPPAQGKPTSAFEQGGG